MFISPMDMIGVHYALSVHIILDFSFYVFCLGLGDQRIQRIGRLYEALYLFENIATVLGFEPGHIRSQRRRSTKATKLCSLVALLLL